jgi:hypothetical protein
MQNNAYTAADFVQFTDAIKRGKTADDLLDAALDGRINLAVYAGSWFAWEAEHKREEQSPVRKVGKPTLLEGTFLFVHRNYIERLRDGGDVAMGMFRSTPNAAVDRWCELAKSQKPSVRQASLRILRSELNSILGEKLMIEAAIPENLTGARYDGWQQWHPQVEKLVGEITHQNPTITNDKMAKDIAKKGIRGRKKNECLSDATIRKALPLIRKSLTARTRMSVKRANKRSSK